LVNYIKSICQPISIIRNFTVREELVISGLFTEPKRLLSVRFHRSQEYKER
jgi:hypothetical protein